MENTERNGKKLYAILIDIKKVNLVNLQLNENASVLY